MADASIAAWELGATGRVTETMIPHRLDRLPWSRWHWRIVIGLGITWILDGFEVTRALAKDRARRVIERLRSGR